MQDFYLIRHGETDWNVKLGKLQGHTDIPLNDKGIRQARALADLTASLKFQRVISSDLKRAFETAQWMTNHQGPQETNADLREVQLGLGEGMTWDEVEQKLGTEFRSRWTSPSDEAMDLRFPEGESRREVIERVQSCILHYLDKYPQSTLAFVTHGFVIRSLVIHTANLENHFPVPNCAVVPFQRNGNQILYKGPKSPGELIQPLILS
jgi:broad specificity phosphatase PhoE